MMVTGSRSVMRILGTSGNDIPKALLSSPMTTVKCSKKSKRCKKRIESSETVKKGELVQNGFLSPASFPGKGDERFTPHNLDPTLFPASLPNFLLGDRSPLLYRSALRDQLYNLLAQESLVHVDTGHLLSVNAEFDDKVDSRLRRETLSRLWCLHSAYYNLSSLIFCKAVCLIDSFVAKVKVKPKYAMCVAAACYYIASKFERSSDVLLPTPESLVTLSRCGGTAADLTRMVEIILSKLSPATVAAVGACSSTALDFLRVFITFGSGRSDPFGTQDNQTTKQSLTDQNPAALAGDSSRLSTFLCRQLEVSLTSTEVARFRPSCLALAILSLYCLPVNSARDIPEFGRDEEFHFSVPDLFNLSQLCGIPWADVDACKLAVKNALTIPKDSSSVQDYPSSRILGSSPPLIWTLSRRTQRSISTSLPPTLSTIVEAEDEEVDHLQDRIGRHSADGLEPLSENQPDATPATPRLRAQSHSF
ncbi:unnamed protein product [Calicophoron daubneyi]|uniref:Cyclin-like domain-containing protein n=1 Tax=Calicophoron daubneyi TaxID=300641 RepID=A0AAV2T0G7_CALDB